jgi:hypothetical protein
MPSIGRPRALDEYKRREVCALISVGCGIEGAARYVGVNPTTIRREATRNPDFHEKLRNAELLERMNPGRYGRRNADTITPAELDAILSAVVEGILDVLPDTETIERVRDRVASIVRIVARQERAASGIRRDPRRPRQFPAVS